MSSTNANNDNADNNEILDINSQFDDDNSNDNNNNDDDVVNVSILGVSTQELGDLHNMMHMPDNSTSLHVRKDLKRTFEQAKEDPSTLRSVADKIAHFEKHAEDSAAAAATAAAATTTASAAMSNDTNTAATTTTTTSTAELGVYLRLRPITDDSSSTIKVIPPSKTNQLFKVRAHAPEHSHVFKISHRPGGGETSTAEQKIVKEYDFSHVFDETCNQETVYQQTLRPFLTGVARANQSALLFCYGMTNSGKTYTVTGPEKGLAVNVGSGSTSSEEPKQQQQQASWGLVPRALQDLLSLVQTNHRSQDQTLFLSYFEIYNEHVYDLLPMTADDDNHSKRRHHHHRHFKKTMTKSNGIMGTAFKGLTMHKITNLEEGLSFIVQAKKNRKSGTNRINRDSSRSHAVCQLRVMTTTTTSNSSSNNKSQQKQQYADMWIVDLAGSERFKRTGGARQQEAAIINKSLMTLNRCLTALRSSQDQNSHNNTIMIPWRESKLTRLFAAHWLGPYAARTCMVVNVHPSANDFDETQHVLAYAAVARTVTLPNEQQQQQQLLDNSSSNSNNQKPAAVEYGYDGRRKQTMVQKVAKVIRKLSPKRALKRKADNNNNNNNNNSNKEAAADDSHKPRYQPAAKKMRTQKEAAVASNEVAALPQNEEQNKQVKALKMALSVAQAEAAVLQARCNELEEQLESIETEVRNEVAEEMETQMLTMREQYGSMMETLKARLDESTLSMNNQTNNKNEQTMLLERAQHKIQDLKEQVAECEDEMKRMREDHQEEMAALCEKYETALREKGKQSESGKLIVLPEHQQMQREEVVQHRNLENDQENTETVHQENDVDITVDEDSDAEEPTFQEDIDMAPADNEDSENEEADDDATQVHENSGNEQLESDEESIGDGANAKTHEEGMDQESRDKEMDESGEDEDEQYHPSTRRMTRLQVRKEVDSESEAGSLETSMKNPCSERKPLGVISENAESQNILSDSESSDGSFGPEKWLRPKNELKKDPATGAFLRPRGRKPKDAEYWDENRGAWRLSDAEF